MTKLMFVFLAILFVFPLVLAACEEAESTQVFTTEAEIARNVFENELLSQKTKIETNLVNGVSDGVMTDVEMDTFCGGVKKFLKTKERADFRFSAIFGDENVTKTALDARLIKIYGKYTNYVSRYRDGDGLVAAMLASMFGKNVEIGWIMQPLGIISIIIVVCGLVFFVVGGSVQSHPPEAYVVGTILIVIGLIIYTN